MADRVSFVEVVARQSNTRMQRQGKGHAAFALPLMRNVRLLERKPVRVGCSGRGRDL